MMMMMKTMAVPSAIMLFRNAIQKFKRLEQSITALQFRALLSTDSVPCVCVSVIQHFASTIFCKWQAVPQHTFISHGATCSCCWVPQLRLVTAWHQPATCSLRSVPPGNAKGWYPQGEHHKNDGWQTSVMITNDLIVANNGLIVGNDNNGLIMA